MKLKIDIASFAGVLLALGLIGVAVVMAPGSRLGVFIDLPSLLMVFGGTMAAAMITVPMRTFLRTGKVLRKVFIGREPDSSKLAGTTIELAEIARRDGLLALEQKLPELEHPLLVLALQMAIDGARPEVIEEVLRAEIAAAGVRHRQSRRVIEQMGRFAPAFGMIGTLLGLILMLGRLSDLASIGTGMAIALTTTLYGVVAANVFFLPVAEKLTFLHNQEVMAMELIVRGIVSIQSGDSPRVVRQKLNIFVEPDGREPIRRAA